MNRERMLKPLTWDQVVFLWNAGNKNFFRTYDDGSEALVGLDEWEDLVKHCENGGGFAIEEDEIFKWDIVIQRDAKTLCQCIEAGSPDSHDLLTICRKMGLSGELYVSATALTIDGNYADSVEYDIYVSSDQERIYLRDE